MILLWAQHGLEGGRPVRQSIRRGSHRVRVRTDRAVAEDGAFMPFADVVASSKILTSATLGPFSDIPVPKCQRPRRT